MSMGVQWLAARNETTVDVAMMYVAMVGVVIVRRGDGRRGDGGQTRMVQGHTVVSWIMISCLDAIESIVLVNGDGGVYCCGCFFGSGCDCCCNCVV